VERCDVLVVGGGPAGSTCAAELHRAGLDVVVTDRATFPRDKPCAGWVTPAALAALRFDARDYQRGGRVFQPFMGFRTSRLGGREVVTQYPEAISFGILRRELDEYLLTRSGARLRLGRAVETLERVSEGWILDDELFASCVVGAGGHFCPLARRMTGGHAEPSVIVVAQEAEIPLRDTARDRCTARPEVPELFFCPDLRGYGWCVRKGDWLNIGFGRQGEPALPRQVQAFLDFLEARMILPDELRAALRGHAYLVYDSSPRPLFGDRFLLVGDAAGLAYPASGEGIRPAIESGLLAARTLIAAGPKYGEADLEPYGRAVRARFGRRERAARSSFLSARATNALARWVLGSPRCTRKLVIERSFLHKTQPALSA
jgi:flavin-dependent dehydrogenase